MPDICNWTHESTEWADVWTGDCGITWEMIDGKPHENDMNFCPKCGKRLVEIETESEE